MKYGLKDEIYDKILNIARKTSNINLYYLVQEQEENIKKNQI